jgi:dihydrofolate reductase
MQKVEGSSPFSRFLPLVKPFVATPRGNSTLLHGDLGDAIHALKKQENGDLLLIGSTTLAQALIKLDWSTSFG